MIHTARWRSHAESRLSPEPALAPEPEPELEPELERELSVTFTNDGPIGLRFLPNEDAAYAVEILMVADDVQQRHPGLGPGMCLTHISGEDMTGLGYTAVLQLLKRAGRPLHLSFRANGATSRLSLGTRLARRSISDSPHHGSSVRKPSPGGSPPFHSEGVPQFEYPSSPLGHAAAAAHRSHLRDARWVSVARASAPNRADSPIPTSNEPTDDGETWIVRNAIRSMKDMSAVLLAHDSQGLARLAAS